MADLDLEELKRLVAEATPGPWEIRRANMMSDGAFDFGIGAVVSGKPQCIAECFGRSSWSDFLPVEATASLIVAAVNALPELIARVERVERAEKVLKAATEYAEANIEYWGAKANEVDYGTEGRSYCKGRVMTALALSNILTGDTPNV